MEDDVIMIEKFPGSDELELGGDVESLKSEKNKSQYKDFIKVARKYGISSSEVKVPRSEFKKIFPGTDGVTYEFDTINPESGEHVGIDSVSVVPKGVNTSHRVHETGHRIANRGGLRNFVEVDLGRKNLNERDWFFYDEVTAELYTLMQTGRFNYGYYETIAINWYDKTGDNITSIVDSLRKALLDLGVHKDLTEKITKRVYWKLRYHIKK